MQRRTSSNCGSEQTNKRDIEKARIGARPQIKETNKHDTEGASKGACPQIKHASKQTDVTSKRHAKALVLKLREQADKLT